MNRNMRVLVAIAASTLGIVTGCGGSSAEAGGGEWAGSVRDSAGVAVVSNPTSGIWTDEERWTLTEELRNAS